LLLQEIDTGVRALVFKKTLVFATSYRLRNVRTRIVQITPITGTTGAELHARRGLIAIDKVIAEHAFLHSAALVRWGIDLAHDHIEIVLGLIGKMGANFVFGLIWTCLHA
jgi:hypothetical protein